MLLWRSLKSKLLLLTLVFLLVSCGFSYNYKGMAGLKKQVYVDYIASVYGNVLRNRLTEYFSGDILPESKYIIKADFFLNIVKSNIDADGFATSKIVYINADWSLYEIATGRLLHKEVTSSFISYSFRDKNYLNNQDEVSSIDSNIIVVAKKIANTASLVITNESQ